MNQLEKDIFSLENFEGPLDFLLHLVQKNEMDIYEIPIQRIMEQYLAKLKESNEPNVETGAEFIGAASLLMWIKSRMLLPKHEQPLDPEMELDPRFEIIHQLIEYNRFKEAAKELSEREQRQNAFFGRGIDGPPEIKKPLGIEHLTLQDLAMIFQDILSKAEGNRGVIDEEIWRVGDKIKLIRSMLNACEKIGLDDIFSAGKSRDELIVTFLGVLELMKLGELKIIKDQDKIMVIHNGERN